MQLWVLGLLVGIVACTEPWVKERCHSNNTNYIWNFTQWSLPPAYSVFQYQTPEPEEFTAVFRFCERIDLVLGDATKQDEKTNMWKGWLHGDMTNFHVTGLAYPQPQFTQVYQFGDQGYSCLQQRNATVNIYCDAVVCPNNATCWSSTNFPSSRDFCICNVDFNSLINPCTMHLDVLMSCPAPDDLPDVNPVHPPHKKITHDLAAGVSILVLALVAAAAYVGLYVYNVKVKNQSGLDAVPGYHLCRRRGGVEYRRTATEVESPSSSSPSHYGSL